MLQTAMDLKTRVSGMPAYWRHSTKTVDDLSTAGTIRNCERHQWKPRAEQKPLKEVETCTIERRVSRNVAYGSVLFDAEEELLKMWYLAWR